MKKLILSFTSVIIIISGFAQTSLDTVVVKQGKVLEAVAKDVAVIKTNVDSAKKYITTQKETVAKAANRLRRLRHWFYGMAADIFTHLDIYYCLDSDKKKAERFFVGGSSC